MSSYRLLLRVSLAAVVAAFSTAGRAQVLFQDDFSGGLANWTGISGVIVADPLTTGRGNVLTFQTLIGGGDTFTTAAFDYPPATSITFDYLGLEGNGGISGDLGGFIGISSEALNGSSQDWMAGTADWYPGIWLALPDDGRWHTITIALNGSLTPFHLMVEDWSGSGGVAGDVYFDNIKVNAIPEPATYATVAGVLALACTIWLRRRRACCGKTSEIAP